RFEHVVPLRREEVNAPPSVFLLVETMMTLNPQQRYQTPAQLVDAIKAARRDVEGGKAAATAGAGTGGKSQVRSVFVVEKEDRLQEPIRDKFKELGYRVFLAGDPVRALERFRQQPYDALVVDAGTTGEDGFLVFEHVLTEAGRLGVRCAGILVLSKDQADW